MTLRRAIGALILLAVPFCFVGPLPEMLATPGFGLMGAEALKLKFSAVLLVLLGSACLAVPHGAVVRVLRGYPRFAAIVLGTAMTLFMLFVIQLVFFGLNTARAYLVPSLQRDPLSTSPTIHDDVLGYRPRPAEAQRDRMMLDGKVVYDVTYTIGAEGQRVVPASKDGAACTSSVVFFGCSYTYGVGCEDDETLPNQFAMRAKDCAVYNLAYGGYGPHQMLAMLEQPGCLDFVPVQKPATGVYVFIRRHVRRVVPCVPLIQRPWVRLAPCYLLDDAGVPRRLGLFPNAIPWRVALYDVLGYEQARRFLNIHFPLNETENDLVLTARILRAAADKFTSTLPGAKFSVLLYPSLHDPPAEAQECGRFFEAEGLKVIDFAAMFGGAADSHTIPGDGHPTSETHRAVAEKLVEELGFPKTSN